MVIVLNLYRGLHRRAGWSGRAITRRHRHRGESRETEEAETVGADARAQVDGMERGGLNGTSDRLRHRVPACLGNVAQAPGAERRADRRRSRTETVTADERRRHFFEPRQESARLSADFLLACQLEGESFPADVSRDLETDAGDYVGHERQAALDQMQIGVGAEPITTFHLFEPAAEAVGARPFDD